MSTESSGNGHEEVPAVECYSGHTYAQRPKSFSLKGEKHWVQAVIKEWREPGFSFFRVKDHRGHSFDLAFDEATSTWSIRAVGQS